MNTLFKKSVLSLSSIFVLCSFTNGTDLSEYTKSQGHYESTFNGTDGNSYDVGKLFKVDLGRRNGGVIGQFIEYSVKSYATYGIRSGGYILKYDHTRINPKAVTNVTSSFSFTHSKTYTFSYSKSIGFDISNSFTAGLKLDGLLNISSENGLKRSRIDTETYTYSYGESETTTYSITYNLNKVPSGYVFAPCIVCSAQILEINYTIYDHYWWGDFESRSSDEVNQNIKLLVYDPSSVQLTICIKKELESGRPVYYLHA